MVTTSADAERVELPVPIIDLSDPQAAYALKDACTEHGFFYVVNHGVPKELVKEQFKASEEFFNLPADAKVKYKAPANRGYRGLYEQKLDSTGNQTRPDTNESYYIGRASEAPTGSKEAKQPFHGPNIWPDDKAPSFKPAMQNYFTAMKGLHERLLQLIATALDLPVGFFNSYFKHPILTLRPIHYTAEQSDPDGGVFGAGAHTDWGFITLLSTNDTPGLEINYKGSWVPVHCTVKDAFVVNLGDLMERWSNGVFKSTLHRVINATPGKERYSCAFFVNPDCDAQISCLPTCLGDGAKYQPVNTAAYLESKYRSTHANFKMPEA